MFSPPAKLRSSKVCQHSPADLPVTALILAGGLGTRLRRVVADRPKVLAPVLGRPFVYYLLEQLKCIAPRRIILLTGYMADMVEQEVGCAYAGMPILYSRERTPLGTAGAVRAALGQIDTDTVLLINGDSYCHVKHLDLLSTHQRQDAALSMVLTWAEDTSRFGRVDLNAEQRVCGFVEKQATGGAGWMNAGVYLLQRNLVEEIAPDKALSLERECIPRWIETTAVFGYSCPGPFLDIGTPESYRAAANFFHDCEAVSLSPASV
jgi:NDP-sugar pyrophosphorylase family protein